MFKQIFIYLCAILSLNSFANLDFEQIEKDCQEIKNNSDADWLITEEGNPQSKVFYRFFSKFEKDKETMIFFIGGPGFSVELYNKQLNWLSDIIDINILGLDYRGLGCASTNEESFYTTTKNYDPNTVVKDMISVLDHLKIDKFYVYGKSYGSVPANIIGSLHPQRVKHIVSDGTVVNGIKALEKDIQDNFDISVNEAFTVFSVATDNKIPADTAIKNPNFENYIRKTVSYGQGLYAVRDLGLSMFNEGFKFDPNFHKPTVFREFSGDTYPSLKAWNTKYFELTERYFLGLCSDLSTGRATERYSQYREGMFTYFNDFSEDCKKLYQDRLSAIDSFSISERILSIYGTEHRVNVISTNKGEYYSGIDSEFYLIPPKINIFNTVKKGFPPITFLGGYFDLQTPLNLAKKVYQQHKKIGNEARFIVFGNLGHTAVFHGNELVHNDDERKYHDTLRKIFLNKELQSSETFKGYDNEFSFDITIQ